MVGAHLAAACAADAVRAEACRICRGAASLAHAAAAVAQRNAGAAVRRRGRHAGRARRPRTGGRGTTRRGARSAAARSALAHPSRPFRGSRLGAGDHRGHLRQDRPRCLADDADRCRRSLRAFRRRPRRLLDHAAQAQSGRGRHRTWPPPPWRPIWRRRSSPRKCRTTNAAPVPGTRNGRHCRACCWSPRARLPPLSISPKGSKSMPRGCAPISTPRSGLIMAEAVTFALAEKIGKSDAHHLVEAASKKAVADKKAPARGAGRRPESHARSSTRKNLQTCSSRWPIRASRRP